MREQIRDRPGVLFCSLHLIIIRLALARRPYNRVTYLMFDFPLSVCRILGVFIAQETWEKMAP